MNRNHKFRISRPEFRNQTLYPVILSVPQQVKEFKPKDRVIFLSRHARHALEISAEKSGICLGELSQDENGAPLPFDGTFWSLTHKPQYVGGVVAPKPIGIDIERIRNLSRDLFRKTATSREWALADTEGKSLLTFFRFWTSKEAVLKATGIGIKDLLKCQVRQMPDDSHLVIHYKDKDWLIEHFFYDQHIASIVKNKFHINWTMDLSHNFLSFS